MLNDRIDQFFRIYLPFDVSGISKEEIKKMNIIAQMSVMGGFLVLLMALIKFKIEGIVPHSWYVLVGIVLFSLFGPFIHKIIRSSIFYTYLYIILIIIVCTLWAIDAGGVQSGAIAWYLIVPLLSAAILDWKGVLYACTLCLAGVVFVYWLPLSGLVSVAYTTNPQVNVIVVSILVVVIGFICSSYETKKEKQISTIKDYEKKVQDAQNFVGLGKMSSTMAHEINNPLMVINLSLQSLTRKSQQLYDQSLMTQEDFDSAKSKIEQCQLCVTNIFGIIRTLKDLAKAENQTTKMIYLQQATDMTLSVFAEKIQQHRIECRVFLGGISSVVVNEFVILRVLENLMSNAIDAISVSPNPWIELEGKVVDHFFYKRMFLIIRDSGYGIHQDVAKKMFDPFFTTKSMGKGTGLGLGLCRSLMEKSGGSISYNPKSINTEFILTFKST